MDGICVEAQAFTAWRGAPAARCLTDRPPVIVPLIVDSTGCDRPDRRLSPTRITLNRYARGADHLVCRQVEHHVVAPEFPVELAGWIERMILPPIAAVDDHLRIPLREVEAAALPPLAPRYRRRPGP